MVTDDFSGVEVVHGDTEEALNLGAVEVHCEDSVSSGGFDGIGADAGANGDTGFVFFVSFGIAEVGDNGGDLSGTRAFEGIDPEQEFHEVFVDGAVNTLDDEAVAAADIFEDSDEDIAFAEHLRLAGSEGDAEAVGDARGKDGVAGSGEDREVSHRCRRGREVCLKRIRGRSHWVGFRAREAGRVPPEKVG